MIICLLHLGGSDMSRVCPVLGKGPLSGNNRSHSLRATRRRWNTNLQVRTVVVDGKEMRIRMSTRAYRSLNKQYKDR
jgi:large subunit ribosomal protein L28